MDNEITQMQKTRVNEIDFMRFIAALVVVLFHYSFRGYAADNMSVMPYPLFAEIAQYGYLGVDLFFMISGFVILMSAASGSLSAFVVSRMVRLYPAFWVCCTATFVFSLFLGGERFPVSVSQYFVNLTMMGGFIGVSPIDGVYWSLFVEMRFYFLVCLVLAFRQVRRIETFLLAWLGLSVFAMASQIPKLSTLLIADWSAYFISGATCYCVWKNGLSLQRVLMFIGALILACYHALIRLSSFADHYQVAPNALVVVLIIVVFHVVFALVATKRTGWVSSVSWTKLGAMTYPLYLLHQNIGFMIINAIYPAMNEHFVMVITTGGMLLAAYAVHRKCERPIAAAMKPLLEQAFARLHPVSAKREGGH